MLRKAQQGFLLISAVIIIVVVGLLAATVSYVVITNSRSMANQLDAMRAHYIAESGLERAIYAVISSEITCSAVTGHASLTNISFGEGAFTAMATLNNPTAATLTAGVNASATVIPLSSINGYASVGRVTIDSEAINYSGTSSGVDVCGAARCLTNAKRGVASTTAASHLSGASVFQSQCSITSTGDVPATSPVIAERQASGVVVYRFGSGWIVGDTTGTETILGWNGSEWLHVGPYSGVANNQLNDVFVNSLTDSWAVGNRSDISSPGLIIHWNGINWADFSASGLPHENLNAVTCVNSSDCWTVGDAATFAHYNGTSWSHVAPDVSVPSQNINDVSCVVSNDCWAVGQKEGGAPLMVHWNGSAWIRPSASGLPNMDLKSVACVAANDCWAVGQSKTFLYYNGTSWANIIPSASVPNTTMNSIDCINANNCWVVGNPMAGDATFVQWNGSTWVRVFPDVRMANQALYDVSCLDAVTAGQWATSPASFIGMVVYGRMRHRGSVCRE